MYFMLYSPSILGVSLLFLSIFIGVTGHAPFITSCRVWT
nr:MAG TPA: hypothetical protein [Caudoviricetes sp.]